MKIGASEANQLIKVDKLDAMGKASEIDDGNQNDSQQKINMWDQCVVDWFYFYYYRWARISIYVQQLTFICRCLHCYVTAETVGTDTQGLRGNRLTTALHVKATFFTFPIKGSIDSTVHSCLFGNHIYMYIYHIQTAYGIWEGHHNKALIVSANLSQRCDLLHSHSQPSYSVN